MHLLLIQISIFNSDDLVAGYTWKHCFTMKIVRDTKPKQNSVKKSLLRCICLKYKEDGHNSPKVMENSTFGMLTKSSSTYYTYTVLPALRVNSCIAIDRLMIELLDFHIPFLSSFFS